MKATILCYVLLAAVLFPNTSYSAEYKEERCLALNIYFEARSESLAGQYAVADVVLNRVESSRFPNDICSVVLQAKKWKGKIIRNKCQFSWYCDGKPDVPLDTDAWTRSIEVAVNIIHVNKFRGITEGSTHYHTDYVDPYWNRNMRLITSIGDHIFYTETL